MQPFLAVITPVGAKPPGYIDNTLPGNQPGIDNSLPGSQPGIDNSLPPFPSFPIYIPITPPPVVDNTLPGDQPEATHPIYIPVYIDNSLPGSQPGIDNTLPGPQPVPTPPIYYPIIPGIPTNPIVIPPEATTPAEIIAALTEAIHDLIGNLPTDPNPKPTPVTKKK